MSSYSMSSATDNVRNDGYAEILLYGGCDGNRSWTAAHTQTLKLPIVEFAIDVLAVMGSYVNIGRIEIPELLYCGKQSVCASSFEWREHLKGEVLGAVLAVKYFCYTHLNVSALSNYPYSVQSYKKSGQNTKYLYILL